jgi:D-alanyl-D-alanine carboxypeptidase
MKGHHMHGHKLLAIFFYLLFFCVIAACEGTELAKVQAALKAAQIPEHVKASIEQRINQRPQRFFDYLESIRMIKKNDPMLLYKVDKAKALPQGFKPSDLVSLEGTELSQSRKGHQLRKPALEALEEMDKAARAAGITLLVSSAYRSYEYQVGVFDRNVKELGKAEAEMVSAMPGHSQHQLGTAIDFGSITDAFAETKAGLWLSKNARRFGFSLSFPKGLTEITGYNWECWHYRYIGKDAASLEGEYFGGVQQYLLLFLDALE